MACYLSITETSGLEASPKRSALSMHVPRRESGKRTAQARRTRGRRKRYNDWQTWVAGVHGHASGWFLTPVEDRLYLTRLVRNVLGTTTSLFHRSRLHYTQVVNIIMYQIYYQTRLLPKVILWLGGIPPRGLIAERLMKPFVYSETHGESKHDEVRLATETWVSSASASSSWREREREVGREDSRGRTNERSEPAGLLEYTEGSRIRTNAFTCARCRCDLCTGSRQSRRRWMTPTTDRGDRWVLSVHIVIYSVGTRQGDEGGGGYHRRPLRKSLTVLYYLHTLTTMCIYVFW